MIINPLNVVRLLLVSINSIYVTETPVTEAEVELKENIQKLLLDGIFHYNGLKVTEEKYLGYQEPYKLHTFEIIEDGDEAWSEDNLNSHPQCLNDNENFDSFYKRRAVEYWRNWDTNARNDGKKKNRSLKLVQHHFKRVSSERQLRRWEEQIESGGSRTDKLSYISQVTHDKFTTAVESGFMVHNIDLKRWALQAQKEIGNLNPIFKASPSWIARFKKSHRIVSRKVTKFVTRKTLEDSVDLQKTANDFLETVKPLIEQFGSENIYNSDQSGFQLEIHSGRSLDNQGVKTVERVVQSVSSTTHSYTIQPIISCNGKLLSPLFIVLKEVTGRFGPRVEENLFKPRNVIVKASKSGKLTSDHFKMWLEEAYFPNIGSSSVLLIDSWTGHCPNIISDLTPPGKYITTMIIPKGTTGKIQPLDVYGFRIWKNFAKRSGIIRR
ncbi:uncharacterized protein [Temnothorax nylanderi]|uniref:uncharacterized protein isoform X2 n=1 Tax=Temnothorax nylanderi TaxID=102681 RepID=UPI003A8A748A